MTNQTQKPNDEWVKVHLFMKGGNTICFEASKDTAEELADTIELHATMRESIFVETRGRNPETGAKARLGIRPSAIDIYLFEKIEPEIPKVGNPVVPIPAAQSDGT